ncbi:hydrolase [Inediibacterium massiliense]|uniref:hydrolase n=1 Tax=Inediibacterium massiliense TaxID=1658111 RepID=UPI0006B48A4C|nr:hydrolase [Inediibacterium massiliense]
MRVLKDHAVAVIIDMQERLLPHMENRNNLLHNVKTLIQGLNALNIPIIVSEQYPKGLGSTIEAIHEILGDYTSIEKMSFSCFDEAKLQQKIDYMNKEWIIVAGIESHICVLQTVIDLIDNGYAPVIVEDCVSSRYKNDKKIAIERMRQLGAIITTTESILFELCRYATTDSFKVISKLVK